MLYKTWISFIIYRVLQIYIPVESSFPILLKHTWTSSSRLKMSGKVEIRSPGAGLSTPELDNKAHLIMKETLNWFTDLGTLGLSFSNRLAGAHGLAWKNAEEPEFHVAAVLKGSLRVEEWRAEENTGHLFLDSRIAAFVHAGRLEACGYNCRSNSWVESSHGLSWTI